MAKKLSRKTGENSSKEGKSLTFSEKILAIREHFSLSQGDLAELIGGSPSTLGLIERGVTSSPNAEMLAAITMKLPINPGWLLTGEGPMLTSDAQAQKISPYEGAGSFLKAAQGNGNVDVSQALALASPPRAGKVDTVIVNPPYQGFSNQGTSNARRIPVNELKVSVLPFLPFGARANFAEHYTDDLNKYPWEHSESLAVLGVPDTKEYAEAIIIDVEGDSMEPTIINGSKVVVTPVQQGNWEYMSSGIYCIIYNGNFVVKRVKDNTLMEKGILHLHSDNPNAGSFPVRGEDIRAVWRVRWAAYVPLQ
jgi:transcriptional regulator with XRE-family HTH domain